MDKAAVVRGLVNSRVFIYKSSYGEKGWIVYENLFEEGPEVKKQVGRFATEKNANTFAALFREELTNYFNEVLNVTVKEGVVKPIADTVMKKMWPKVATDDPEPKRGYEPKNPVDDPY